MYLVTGWALLLLLRQVGAPLRAAPLHDRSMINALPFLWQGLLVTLQVSAVVVVVALVLGVTVRRRR